MSTTSVGVRNQEFAQHADSGTDAVSTSIGEAGGFGVPCPAGPSELCPFLDEMRNLEDKEQSLGATLFSHQRVPTDSVKLNPDRLQTLATQWTISILSILG